MKQSKGVEAAVSAAPPVIVAGDTPAPTAPTLQRKPDSGRFASRNIRLSAALCTLGFDLRTDAEPVGVTIDYDTGARIVTFFHSPEPRADAPVRATAPKLVAIDVEGWWKYPGTYSIEGFDDALSAIRHGFESREWLIKVARGMIRIRNAEFVRDSVGTNSLHLASAIRASGVELAAFHPRERRFIFPRKAAPIAALLASEDQTGSVHRQTLQTFGRDLCLDWMTWAFKYHDWLKEIVRDPGCIPIIEMRDGEKVLRISSQMPATLKKEWLSHL